MTQKISLNTLNRDEFREHFIKPLESEFGYKVYWNGKHLKDLGLPYARKRGYSCTSKKEAPIVLRYTKNSLDLLNTLFHELGHSYLHNKSIGLGCDLSQNIKEFEAETVAIKTFQKLKINYIDGDYANRHYLRCSEDEKLRFKHENRIEIIESLATRIANILSSEVEFINTLNKSSQKNEKHKKEDYKYKVTCPICKTAWKYKRSSTKIIKNSAKGYYCNKCGKDATKDKLIIEKI